MSGINFSIIFNLSGQPAISIPVGFSAYGLPIGIQIAGRSFEEALVLRLAYAYQQQKTWFKIRPDLKKEEK
jgi:aspartyl-tRNA(Asn)/glutamyl-tRNA(Gln) amidotransferase subunit A